MDTVTCRGGTKARVQHAALILIGILLTPFASAGVAARAEVTPPPDFCAGDCNGDDLVTIDELVTGINMAIGVASADACSAFCDPVCGPICDPPCTAVYLPTVTTIVRAVSNAVNGCPGDGSRELRWYEACGPPIVGDGACPDDIRGCTSEALGAPCAEFGEACCQPTSRCKGAICNDGLICRRTAPNHCPISRRRYKRAVAYLKQTDLARLRDEVLAIKLATFQYRSEATSVAPHLGFMIDDVEPSMSVDSSGDRVDLYGYTSMAVAAIQVQAAEIETLHREIEDLRRALAAQRPSEPVHSPRKKTVVPSAARRAALR